MRNRSVHMLVCYESSLNLFKKSRHISAILLSALKSIEHSLIAIKNINKLMKDDVQGGWVSYTIDFPKPWITFSNSKQDVFCKCLKKTDFKGTAIVWIR